MQRRALLVAGAVLALAVGPAVGPGGADEHWPPPECGPATAIATDVVGCVALPSGAVGGIVPVAYYLPSACTRARPCPVLYQLHGFAGDYRSQLGTAEEPSGWVHALTSRPPVDPHEDDAPWQYADPATWEPAEPLDFIFVAPHGRTVPGGFGPAEGLDSFWADWNPRHSDPAPRFASFLVDELLPYVEAHFPTVAAREWRALTGVSLGGYGAFKNGLQHPDVWAALGSVSGAHNFLFAPAPQPGPGPDAPQPPPGAEPIEVPAPLGGTPLPPGPAAGFAAAFHALGDPVADQAYYRGNMPVDLARNARAVHADAAQALVVDYFVNDAVARRAEDYTSPERFFTDQAFEAIVLPMNTEMELAFDAVGVERGYSVNPGIHSGAYWNPFLRGHLERLRDGLRRPGGTVAVFDYRSIGESFQVWDWGFAVQRGQVEFLDLFGVRCDRLTLRGTGTVTVTAPQRCGTGVDGERTFAVDLGPGAPVLAPTGVNVAAHTVTVELQRLPAPAPGATPVQPQPDPGLPATGGTFPLGAAVLLCAAVAASRHTAAPPGVCRLKR